MGHITLGQGHLTEVHEFTERKAVHLSMAWDLAMARIAGGVAPNTEPLEDTVQQAITDVLGLEFGMILPESRQVACTLQLSDVERNPQRARGGRHQLKDSKQRTVTLAEGGGRIVRDPQPPRMEVVVAGDKLMGNVEREVLLKWRES